MITCITGRGTEVSLAFVPDCGENESGYYVEVYLDASGDRHDDFCIHPDDCDCDDEVIIAKIITDENGESLYVEPTDEEFERVAKAYDELTGGE